VRRRGLLLIILTAACLSCGRHPGKFSVPPQDTADYGPDPDGPHAFVNMDDPVAEDYFVHDISTERGYRRWAFAHPVLRFRLSDIKSVTFVTEFALPEATYKVTGPVTVDYFVAGHKLGSLRCDHPGDYRISKPVPEDWLEAGEFLEVSYEANPRWISPDDGAQLSFFLRSAGFIH
jgi:hypothetical protein